MLKAFSKGISQLNDGPTRQVLLLSIGISLVVFISIWSGVAYSLTNTALFQIGWIETAIDVLGGLATMILTWFLFPGVVSAVMALYLERVCEYVEARHYTDLSKTDGLPLSDSMMSSLRFVCIFIVLNILMLPFLFLGPVFPFVFYSVNGYLLSREYFELVATRRLSLEDAKTLRKANQGQLFVAGVIIALLLTIPVVNLVAPVVATAAMVHLFETWRREQSGQITVQ